MRHAFATLLAALTAAALLAGCAEPEETDQPAPNVPVGPDVPVDEEEPEEDVDTTGSGTGDITTGDGNRDGDTGQGIPASP